MDIRHQSLTRVVNLECQRLYYDFVRIPHEAAGGEARSEDDWTSTNLTLRAVHSCMYLPEN